jgi:hypothetical protein
LSADYYKSAFAPSLIREIGILLPLDPEFFPGLSPEKGSWLVEKTGSTGKSALAWKSRQSEVPMVGSADVATDQRRASQSCSSATGTLRSGENEQAERFLQALYHGMLRREPYLDGWLHYLSCILSGGTHTSIAEEFIASEEFRPKLPWPNRTYLLVATSPQ